MLVSLSPGIHLRRLQKLLGASFSTTRYHVDGLERDGEIVRTKDGRYDRLYPAGTTEQMKAVYATLQSRTARKVLRAITEGAGRGETYGDLAAQLGIAKSTLSESFARLCEADLVRRTIALDGRVTYEVPDKDEALRLLAVSERGALATAADSFIDLWDL